jgi:hypothetical protein
LVEQSHYIAERQKAKINAFPVNKLSDLKATGIHVNERPAPNVKEKIVEIICCADES